MTALSKSSIARNKWNKLRTGLHGSVAEAGRGFPAASDLSLPLRVNRLHHDPL